MIYFTEDQHDDGKQSHQDEYVLAEEEPESALSQEPEEPQELSMPMVEESNRKEKRWIWSKKTKKEKKGSWVFNTNPTEGAQGTVLPEDEHVRNRAAELYGNQYDKSINHVSRSNPA